MQVFVKLHAGQLMTVHANDTTRVIDVKRQIGETMLSDYSSENRNSIIINNLKLMYCGKLLDDLALIEDIVPNEGTMHATLKMLAGSSCERTQNFNVYTDIDFGGKKIHDKIEVLCSPKDTIGYLISYVIEELHTILKHTLTSGDVIISYNDQVLNPNRFLAEYKDLSKSFIEYNAQDHIVKYLGTDESTYYQYRECGSRTDNNPNLILSLKQNHVHSYVVMDCHNCVNNGKNSQYSFITPCCRKRVCDGCQDRCMFYNKCVLCNKEKFNVFQSK